MAIRETDLVLHDGIILGHPASDSIAVSDGRITAIGNFATLKKSVGPRAHLVRLDGRTVVPGFIDSHLHFMEAAAASAGLQVSRARNIAELLADLRKGASRTAPGNWLKAFGCDEALLRECRGPTRKELDDSVPRNPLRLRHQTLHASWLNSRAIQALGLENPDFKLSAGANLVHDGGDRLTGLVTGMEEWITNRLPRVTSAEIESRARAFSRELAANGTTAFTDATVRNGLDEMKLFAQLRSAGCFCQRASLMIGEAHIADRAEALALTEAAGIKLSAVKFMPNEDADAIRIADAIAAAMREGLDCAFHATEIEELECALSTIESARRRQEAGATRWRIEHGGVIPPDYIPRLRSLGAWVVTNPGFVHFRGIKYQQEPGLIPHLYRLRSLKLAGIEVAGATDAPVTPARPLAAIAAASSRTATDGNQLAPEETIELEDAFALFTRSAARLLRIEAGEIAVGKLADLVVLPNNPMELPPAKLASMPIEMTIIGGQIVYERGVAALQSGMPDL